MSLLGNAAVAMWWNVAEEHRPRFHEWHSKEHLPERLGIAGFRRGSRWQKEGSGDFFVIYELADYDTLVSDGYLARLNDPTPWSQEMMPLHRDMVRSQCRVVASHGRGVAALMATVRLSPAAGQGERLLAHLETAVEALPQSVGITGAHLLRTDTPQAAVTTEQQIRGGDATADWIVLVTGHDAGAIDATLAEALSAEALTPHGVDVVSHDAHYRLVHALVPQDV
ncbi:MAG: hypothetical protein WBA44_01220 [Mesorhizobium sp.]